MATRIKKVGDRRLANYLAKNHQETYLEIDEEHGLVMARPMDEIEPAAMWRDTRLLDYQAQTVLWHLSFHFESKITVPFHKMYLLVEGYTKPRVKVFEYHLDGEKHSKIVHAQFQDITKEFARCVEESIAENNVRPEHISKIILVVGGDHGQGGFRVVFRTLLIISGLPGPLYKTKAIAEVYCNKEEGVLEVLDKSVMP